MVGHDDIYRWAGETVRNQLWCAPPNPTKSNGHWP